MIRRRPISSTSNNMGGQPDPNLQPTIVMNFMIKR
jgi:hypothetical protein